MSDVTPQAQKSHRLRTYFAALMGTAAVCLILGSLTVVWLNRTLTNTPTYVNTVAPLVQKPAVQNFMAEKVTDELLNNTPIQDLAAALIPTNQLNSSQTTAQLQNLVRPVVNSSVLTILQSPSFALLWTNANRSAHQALVSQLQSGSSQITLDLSPAVNGVITQLKATKLSPAADKVSIKPDTGKLQIKSNGLKQAHRFYRWFQAGTIIIVLLALISLGLAVWLSVHHGKTLRRILVITGILALLQAFLLEAPRLIKLSNTDPTAQAAAKAIVEAIFRHLQIASLGLGIVCLALALGSKAYSIYRTKRTKHVASPARTA